MAVWQISPEDPDPDTIQAAVSVIQGGGIIAFPTSTLYGLGANASNPRAVARIFDIKGRQAHQPILVLVKHKTRVAALVKEVPAVADTLMECFWPGGITLVFKAGHRILPALTGNSGKIGIRVPKHPVTSALVATLDNPLTGTSANISGQDGCADIAEMDEQVMGQLDGVLDAGRLKGGKGSTVVDVTIDPPEILREGTISRSQIHALF
jgi:L-threonylcarbamoyladenylate synthase